MPRMPLLQVAPSGSEDKPLNALEDTDMAYGSTPALFRDPLDSRKKQVRGAYNSKMQQGGGEEKEGKEKDVGYGFVFEDGDDEDDTDCDVLANPNKRRKKEQNDHEWMFFDVAKVCGSHIHIYIHTHILILSCVVEYLHSLTTAPLLLQHTKHTSP
jgi:hypothetical protein